MSDTASKANPKIITVTLNPSLVRRVVTHYLGLGYRNRVTENIQLVPSGRGINIARALHRLECDTCALVLLGSDAAGSAYSKLAADESFETIMLYTKSTTNSEVVLVDTGHNTETCIFEDTAEATEDDMTVLMERLLSIMQKGDYVVFAGGLPRGLASDAYAILTERVHSKGAKVVLVTEGKALEDALRGRPELIVLTTRQAEAYFNYPIRTAEGIINGASKIQSEGALRVLVVDNERMQAVLVDEESSWLVELHEDDAAHAITNKTVWDAFVAGYLTGRIQRNPLEDSLELGAAAASYTMSHEDNDFGTEAEIAIHQDDFDMVELTDEDPETQ